MTAVTQIQKYRNNKKNSPNLWFFCVNKVEFETVKL